jgi:hypothetical protein
MNDARSRRLVAVALATLLPFLLAACGGSSSSEPGTPAACDLGALRGSAPIRYRLVTADRPPYERGSTVAYRDPHVMREFPPPEPLSGTLDFVALSPLPEGMRVALRLVGYDLHGAGRDLPEGDFFVPGSGGTIIASATSADGVSYDLYLGDYQVSGTAPASTIDDACPPSFDGLEMLGQTSTSMLRMRMRLVAVPE